MNNNNNSLFIYSIELSNYRQYYGKSIIEFTRSHQKNFTIIQGSNGLGKTSLLNSISWCLYGKEKDTIRVEEMPIINTRAIKETPIGENIEMEVTLKIGDSKNLLYMITRKINCFKETEEQTLIKEGGVLIPEGLDCKFFNYFQIWSEEKRGWNEFNYFDTAVSQLLPANLGDFFLFDGEDLVGFFTEGLSKVQKGIEEMSQISLISHAIKHLESIEKNYRGKTKGFDPNADRILEQIQRIDKIIQIKDIELQQKIKERDPLDKRLKEIDDELRNSDRELIREKQKNRENQLLIKGSIYEKLKLLKGRRINQILNLGPQIYLNDCLKNTNGAFIKAINEGLLPAPITLNYCKTLLEKGTCICGNDISHGVGRENVSRLLNRAKLSPIRRIVDSGPIIIGRILESFEENFKELDQSIQERKNLEYELDQIQLDIKNIEIQLKNFDEENISLLVDEREAKTNLLKTIDDNIAVIRSDIDRYKRFKIKEEENHAAYLELNKRIAKYKIRIDLCKESSTILYDIQSQLLHEVRHNVEDKTKKFFLSIIWKKGTFVDLVIDSAYNIKVSHIDGWNATGSLSAGERLYLALSFIAALREITGFKFPIIIDTPLGRVSGKSKILAAENLPKYLPGTQITMFVTDTEYASPVIDEDSHQEIGSFRDKVIDFVGIEHKLTYNEKERDTNVIEYGN